MGAVSVVLRRLGELHNVHRSGAIFGCLRHFFWRNPFGEGVPEVLGFQFFAEHRSLDAGHFFVAHRVRTCKEGCKMDGPMLCSGTMVGTRQSMLDFLSIMHEEMKVWMIKPQCCFNSHGGNQAIMNHLYYGGFFNNANPPVVAAWHGGIVNTVGRVGHSFSKAHHRGAKTFTR